MFHLSASAGYQHPRSPKTPPATVGSKKVVSARGSGSACPRGHVRAQSAARMRANRLPRCVTAPPGSIQAQLQVWCAVVVDFVLAYDFCHRCLCMKVVIRIRKALRREAVRTTCECNRQCVCVLIDWRDVNNYSNQFETLYVTTLFS